MQTHLQLNGLHAERLHTGIASRSTFNHSDFCWATRLLPRVNHAFSTVRLCLLNRTPLHLMHVRCGAASANSSCPSTAATRFDHGKLSPSGARTADGGMWTRCLCFMRVHSLHCAASTSPQPELATRPQPQRPCVRAGACHLHRRDRRHWWAVRHSWLAPRPR
jgi:hypothetical protein